ncbi:hypothetical protein F5X99DRAFT_381339 [Biscogniauxia marginata]|nr:hypothetical protein F5X99DRAFT_381339 [Biscogniauxia marginata]
MSFFFHSSLQVFCFGPSFTFVCLPANFTIDDINQHAPLHPNITTTALHRRRRDGSLFSLSASRRCYMLSSSPPTFHRSLLLTGVTYLLPLGI